MKQEKAKKSYLNYFKKWEGAGMLGLILTLVGFAFLWLGLSFFSYIMAILLMPVGLAIFFYGSVGRVGEADLQNEIDRHRDSIQFPELEENAQFHFRGRIPKDMVEKTFEGFVLRDGLYIKKLKNGSPCSEEYTCAKMLILTDAFLIKTKTFSFLTDAKESDYQEILFSALEDVFVERERVTVHTAMKKAVSVKKCALVLVFDGGKQLSLLAKDDIYIDEFEAEIKRKYMTR